MRKSLRPRLQRMPCWTDTDCASEVVSNIGTVYAFTSSVKDRPSRTEGREEKRREKDKEWFGITTISHCSAKWKTMVSLIAVSSFVFG